MSPSLTLLLVMGVLYAAGFYLVLGRRLMSKLIGILLVGNATNILILLMSGRPGAAPILGGDEPIADPLPQALILTAIVITFGLTAFLLALVYRRWWLAQLGDRSDEATEDRIEAEEAASVFTGTREDDEALERALESEDDDPMPAEPISDSRAVPEPGDEGRAAADSREEDRP